MQDSDGPSAKLVDDDTYRMMVLRFEQTEDEVDQHFLQTALDLGINIPQDPATTLDLVTNSVSALNINAEPSEPIEPILPDPSRASPSIHTASDSSIEQQTHRKTPSLAATSITSASLSSVASSKSNIVKVRKGFRRFSRLHRRKTSAGTVPDVPPRASSMLNIARPDTPPPRAITIDQVPTVSDPEPHATTTDQMHTLKVPQTRLSSISYNAPHSTQRTDRSTSLQRDNSLEAIAGRRRSISNPVLKKLRTTQLQEQLRFISFEASQKRLMRTRHLQKKRECLSEYHDRQKNTHSHHAEALSSLENRHLNAEVELNRTLQMERQACETRLKHMQAYCNPRSNVEGMPERVVTKADYRQLEQQYHIRNGMDNLHTSRINVLRERQGKQIERIMAKQETELENIELEFDRENKALEARFHTEEAQLQEDFAERKRRLVSRWNIAEAIERKRLELQCGEEHGPLPTLTWSSDLENRSSGPPSPVSSRGSRGRSRDGPIPEANLSYDAMNVI